MLLLGVTNNKISNVEVSASPGTVTASATLPATGAIQLQDPSNASADDGVYASWPLFGAPDAIGYYGLFTNFGFAVPSTKTIDNVKITIKIELTNEFASGDTNATDYSLRLIKGGVVVGNDKADLVTEFTNEAYVYREYSFTPAQWGVALTHSDVNASDFGFAYCVRSNGFCFNTVALDYGSITLTYS